MRLPKTPDLHMHTLVSDGTDSPAEILQYVREKGLDIFSITDHDAIAGCLEVQKLLTADSPVFIKGVEFSCRDDAGGKYHILGYDYDETRGDVKPTVDHTHRQRMKKLEDRLVFLKDRFGYEFSKEDTDALFALSNPGKPHLAKLMVKYGFAETIDEAITVRINKRKEVDGYISPEQAIAAVLSSGGVPVLAHPAFGDGSQHITGVEMEDRVKCLKEYGLQGMECFYSGFSDETRAEMLALAEKYDLYVTAGSDYHGTNKKVILGDTGYYGEPMPAGMIAFYERCLRNSFGS